MGEPSDPFAAIEHAASLARSGAVAEARAQADAAAAACAHDVNVLHRAGVVMQLCGAHEAALRLFHAALAVWPNFHFTEMEIGSTRLAMREPEAALRWFRKAAESAPGYALAHRRAGQTLEQLGRHREALDALQRAHAIEPGDPEIAAALAGLLIFHNRRDKAAEAYEAVAAAGRMRDVDRMRHLMLLTELGQFERVASLAAQRPDQPTTTSQAGYEWAVLSGHALLATTLDRPALFAAARDREASPRWLDAPAVLARLRGAIAERRPLSLIRLGDGEARFLAYFDPALRTRLGTAQAEVLGDVPFRNWFGQSVAQADPAELVRLHAAFVTAIEQADVLGVSTASRLETDHRHVGYLGHMEQLVASVLRGAPETSLADAFVHLDLHRAAPFYGDILAGLDFLGMVSPHPGLAHRLARLHGIARVDEYLIPGESRLPKDRQNRGARPHFPEVYHDLLAGIAVPHSGAVFLVAGGLLAKIYCAVIRRRGGIAIDMGSIADAWMGLNTRPGTFERTDDWALPPEPRAAPNPTQLLAWQHA